MLMLGTAFVVRTRGLVFFFLPLPLMGFFFLFLTFTFFSSSLTHSTREREMMTLS